MSTTEPATEPTSGTRRYPRSFGALVGSMIVLVLAVVAYWALQSFAHPNEETKPVAVDYLDAVAAAQGAHIPLVYPPSLPEGWMATDARLDRAEGLAWSLPMLTAKGKYVGLQQEDHAKLSDLVATYVEKDAQRGQDVTLESAVATTWSTWSDSGGDHAFAAEVGDAIVLVYGSAPVADLETVVRSLTTAPVG
ncbi:DUF4245 domain-containing protein [Nocardioides sp.]|uniref:DUF4245 domain-containing protein n=1 Tax=Nocardioides sp. TaxID=35761 RepID=UPI0039E6ACA7